MLGLRLSIIFVLFATAFVFAQPLRDTIVTAKGKMVLHEDHTWSMANDASFKGIMNTRIHRIVSSFSRPVKQSWSNESVFTQSNNQLASMKDTIWLCVNEYAEESKSDFTFPLKKVRVNSRYGARSGRYHNGIDLDLRVGDTVYAMFSGKVRYAKFNTGGFGNLVILRHYNALETFYAHLSKFLVSPNEYVTVGQPIALGGSTGRSTGPHLHLEVRFYEEAINPEEIIDFDRQRLKKENFFLHKNMFRPGAQPSGETEVLSKDQLALQRKRSDIQQAAAVSAPVVRPVMKTSSKKFHQIKSGENLSKIASKYGITVGTLCKLNGISPSTKLVVGRSLRVK